MAGGRFVDLPKKTRRRLVARALWDVLWINVLLFGLYLLLPLRNISGAQTLLLFIGGLVVFAVAVLRQVTSIVASDYPRLRAIVGIGTAIPMLIVVFSAVYVALSIHHPASFSEPIDKVGGLYFTITILATVGFGDIVAKTDVTRIVVTIQMIFDLTLVGVVIKAIGGAVTRGEEAVRAEPVEDTDPD